MKIKKINSVYGLKVRFDKAKEHYSPQRIETSNEELPNPERR